MEDSVLWNRCHLTLAVLLRAHVGRWRWRGAICLEYEQVVRSEQREPYISTNSKVGELFQHNILIQNTFEMKVLKSRGVQMEFLLHSCPDCPF
nr:hypothetical protein CFP56_47655 [Quercus suber]